MGLKEADLIVEDHRFFVKGELCFSTIMSLYEKSLAYLAGCAELDFDFSLVKSSDSSGLALIIEWMQFASRHHKRICFSALSTDLLALATVSGLDKIIPTHPTQL